MALILRFLCSHPLTHSFALSKVTTLFFSSSSALSCVDNWGALFPIWGALISLFDFLLSTHLAKYPVFARTLIPSRFGLITIFRNVSSFNGSFG